MKTSFTISNTHGTNPLATIEHGKALLYDLNGTTEVVNGPLNELQFLYTTLQCRSIQMIPCTIGTLAQNAFIICDEEGMLNGAACNHKAESDLGNQVYGGKLYGKVILLHASDFQ